MTWWAALPVILVVAVVTFLPGTVLLGALGVRGLPLVALAPAATAGVLGGGAILAGLVGVPWSPLLALVLIAAGALAAAGFRRRFGDPEALRLTLPDIGGRVVWGGGLVAALVGALPIVVALRRLDRPPQTYDSIFHLNAVRYIEETGKASSLLLGGLYTPVSGRGFYPAGWHVLAATAADLIGADPAAVANATTLVLAAAVLPAGTALAAHVLMPAWRWAAAVGAVTGTLFASLPVLMATFGTLWPNAWATSCLPAVLGATILSLRRPHPSSWAAVLLALAGVTLLHPAEFFGFVYLVLPFLVPVVATRWSRLRASARSRRVVVEAVVPTVLLVIAAMLVSRSAVLAAVRQFARGPSETLLQGFIEPPLDIPLTGSPYGLQGPSWVLAVLLGLGALQALRTPQQRAWAVSLAVAVTLFAISAGVRADNPLRTFLTQFWYNDPIRLAGQVPVIAAPLVALGIWSVARGLARAAHALRVLQGDGERIRLVRLAGVPLLALLVLLLTGGGYAAKREGRITFYYWPPAQDGSRQLVSAPEEGLLRALPRILPRDAVILADPYNGGSLAYALGDRQVVFPHVIGTYSAAARDALRFMPDLRDPRTCSALGALGVRYLYVDDQVYLEGEVGQPGYRQLDDVPTDGVRLIRAAGSAALYEITDCRRP